MKTGWHNLCGVLTSWFDPKFCPQSAYDEIFAIKMIEEKIEAWGLKAEESLTPSKIASFTPFEAWQTLKQYYKPLVSFVQLVPAWIEIHNTWRLLLVSPCWFICWDQPHTLVRECNKEGEEEEEGEGLVHLHALAAPANDVWKYLFLSLLVEREVGNATLVTLLYWKTWQVRPAPTTLEIGLMSIYCLTPGTASRIENSGG